jgi:hypothetical protein
VRNTGEMFELIENIKEVSENINLYISIYPDTDAEIENIKFYKKYEISVERAGREIMTNMKNSACLQFLSKRRKLTRS